jgi:hypothetical protein
MISSGAWSPLFLFANQTAETVLRPGTGSSVILQFEMELLF